MHGTYISEELFCVLIVCVVWSHVNISEWVWMGGRVVADDADASAQLTFRSLEDSRARRPLWLGQGEPHIPAPCPLTPDLVCLCSINP